MLKLIYLGVIIASWVIIFFACNQRKLNIQLCPKKVKDIVFITIAVFAVILFTVGCIWCSRIKQGISFDATQNAGAELKGYAALFDLFKNSLSMVGILGAIFSIAGIIIVGWTIILMIGCIVCNIKKWKIPKSIFIMLLILNIIQTLFMGNPF